MLEPVSTLRNDATFSYRCTLPKCHLWIVESRAIFTSSFALKWHLFRQIVTQESERTQNVAFLLGESFLKASLLLGTLLRISTYECIDGSDPVSLTMADTVCSQQSWSALVTHTVHKTQVLQEFPLDPAGDPLRLLHVCAKSEAGGKFYSPITNPWNMDFHWKCWHSHDFSDTYSSCKICILLS